MQAKDCNFHIFVGPWSKFSDCDKAKDYLTKSGLSFTSTDLPAGSADNVITKIGNTELKGFNDAAYKKALTDLGYSPAADKNAINWPMTLLILWVMLIYVTMVYGPIAAFLVELFPTRIRYTSMSLPYHIGNGWFGGMLPLLATAMVAAKRRHLLRPVVSDHRRADHRRRRFPVPLRDEERRPARGRRSRARPPREAALSCRFSFRFRPRLAPGFFLLRACRLTGRQ